MENGHPKNYGMSLAATFAFFVHVKQCLKFVFARLQQCSSVNAKMLDWSFLTNNEFK
jgi:hypothetical protein